MSVEMVTFDGRLLFLALFIFLLLAGFIISTLNIWLENIDLRKRLGRTGGKSQNNFMDWFSNKIADHPFFLKIIVFVSVPVVAAYMWIKYPAQCFKKSMTHFSKQIKAAKESIWND